MVVFNPGANRAQTLFEMDKLWGTNQSITFVTTHKEWGRVGSSLVRAGDINGDGVDDLAIGTEGFNTAYVVYGSRKGNGVHDLTAANGITVERVQSSDRVSVHGPGDLNSDGIDDLVVGADDMVMDAVKNGNVIAIFGARNRVGMGTASTTYLCRDEWFWECWKHLAEFKTFQRSFPQYYQMHHEDYTVKRIQQNKLPIIFVVASAWKVKNPVLDLWFSRRKQFMSDVLHRTDEELEERVAFHGTRDCNISSICTNGLLRDPHFGVYASRFVEYTLQYSNMRATSEGNELPWPLDEGESVKIVMLRALPGRTLHMGSFAGAVKPAEGYDSHSSPQWSEWFFFDETQMCPTYVVEVKAITNTRIEANEGM
eukprot:m51a1_g4422 hypothetical protein (369) ;mRNA; f:34720-37473